MRRFISKSISRSGESGSESQDNSNPSQSQSAYEKRRAQVRKAQRKHRDRKATYLKALEHEVVNLRADNQLHRDEVAFLRRVLVDNGIVAPAWRGDAGKSATAATATTTTTRPSKANAELDFNAELVMLTVSKESGLGRPLRVAFPQGKYVLGTGEMFGTLDTAMDGVGGMSLAVNGDVGGITAGMQEMGNGSYVDSTGGYTSGLESQSGQESNPQDAIDLLVGVDWVLALEHPCMAHFDMICPPFGTHSHMASNRLLQSAPETLHPSAPSTWQVPSTSIQSLLSLSSSFQLQGELTPVQAWYRLKLDPRFGKLVQAQLDMLGNLLTNDVKCYGFGAVIDEDLWMLAVEEVLSQTR